MNILISCMGYDSGKSGISSYMRNVTQNLKTSPHTLTLIIEHGDESDFEGFRTIVVPRFFSKSLLGMIWHFLVIPFYTLSKQYDCILILAASRRYLAFSRIPQIGVIHDLSPYRIANKYDPLRMFYLRKLQPFLGRRLNAIAAISKSTISDIEKYWHIPAEKITLAYNGLNKLPASDPQILSRLRLGQYILYVSRIEYPGKNHIGLMKAYELLPEDLKNKYSLVMAGSEWKGSEPVKEYAVHSPNSNRIIFTGFISAAELSCLYQNASLFVFPSFSEGFGLPLLEAMSQSVPCTCSNCTSLSEIGGDAVLKFSPDNPQNIRDCMRRILSDKALSDELIRKGLIQSSRFSWNEHAQTLIKMCETPTANT